MRLANGNIRVQNMNQTKVMGSDVSEVEISKD
jgi:hypothetical protein